MKRTHKKHSRKQSKRSCKKRTSKKRSQKKSCKKTHITYQPRSRKFILSQRISRHQCSSFLGNTLNPNLKQFITPSCSMCTDNST
jgi:hypothetical protein